MTFIIEAKTENDKIINSANISHNSVILFGTRDIAVTKQMKIPALMKLAFYSGKRQDTYVNEIRSNMHRWLISYKQEKIHFLCSLFISLYISLYIYHI